MLGTIQPIRAFVSVKPDEDSEASYTSVTTAIKDDYMRQQLLMAALRELESFKAKYDHLNEFVSVFAAIENTRKRVSMAYQPKPQTS